MPGDYYPNTYWVQPNAYPIPQKRNTLAPWIVIFLLIVASFYTIYVYIQPEFSLSGIACSQKIVVVKLLTSKPGRFFMGEFKLVLPKSGVTFSLRTSASVELGQKLEVPIDVNLQPGNYQFDIYFRGKLLGRESCTVK